MIDLASLRDDKPRFKMSTERLGEIWCYSIESREIGRIIERNFSAYRKMDSVQFLSDLFGKLTTDSNDLPLASGQFEKLTDEERTYFFNKLIEHHGIIFKGRKGAERRSEETVDNYITRVLIDRAEISLARNRYIAGWAGSPTMDALARAQSLSDQLYRPQIAKIPPFPTFRNPLDATNAHLAALEKRFETSMAQTSELYELVRSVNSAATGLLSRPAKRLADQRSRSRLLHSSLLWPLRSYRSTMIAIGSRQTRNFSSLWKNWAPTCVPRKA